MKQKKMPKKIKLEATVKNIDDEKAIDVIYQVNLRRWLACLPQHYGYTNGEKVNVNINPVKKDKADVAKNR